MDNYQHTRAPGAASRLSDLALPFVEYARAELGFADQSLAKYSDCLRQVLRLLGDKPISAYDRADLLRLKAEMLNRGHSVSRQVSILSAFKRLLEFCQGFLGLPLGLEPASIAMPKRPRREVIYLTAQEVGRFVAAIDVENERGQVRHSALRFRALVEALLGSGMRIGELLSLDRQQVDFQAREAKLIGKGNKE
ncbi:MAG TPA: tyrosine-type recombinase/integrase, partial [Clostridia bacterium]|nr:tyrosine-type recombinase/integrase [Clostridia bacterium]